MRKQYEHPEIKGNKKQCTKCKNFKNFSDFHKYSKSPDGHKHFCKSCVREYDQLEDDPKRIFPRKYNEEGKVHCRNCGGYFEESQMKQSKIKKYKGLSYCNECAPLLQRTRLLTKYGLTIDSYHKILEEQNYACKICKQKDTTFRKRLSVDHDHSCCAGTTSCGKCIRGLLCHHCNAALGNVKDNIEVLKTMIKYLEGVY